MATEKILKTEADLFRITYSDGDTSYHRTNRKHNYKPQTLINSYKAIYRNQLSKGIKQSQITQKIYTDTNLICEKIASGTVKEMIELKAKLTKEDINSIDAWCSGAGNSGKRAVYTVPADKSKVLKSTDKEIVFVEKNWLIAHYPQCTVKSIHPFNRDFIEPSLKFIRG